MKRSFDLVGSLRERLMGIGYAQLPIRKDAFALFFKPVEGLFLTLGIEVSSRQRQTFTGSFYLAPLFSWAYAPPDEFPEKAYGRIGHYLTPAERREVEPDASTRQVDVWWHGFTPENTQQFARLVQAAESRLLRIPGLVNSVKNCVAMRDLLGQTAAVQQEHQKVTTGDSRLIRDVRKEQTVPVRWYVAAARVARGQFRECNHKDGIKMLAEESWLLSEFGKP